MPDTRHLPRVGAMRIVPPGYKPNTMFEDSWAVCPSATCNQGDDRPCNERDGTAWYDWASCRWRDRNGHEWDSRFGRWEVQSR